MAQSMNIQNSLSLTIYNCDWIQHCFILILVNERIDRLQHWWWMNNQFSVKDNYSVQKLLDIFFS